MKNNTELFYIDIKEIYSYIEDGIREGKLWPHLVVTENGDSETTTFAIKMYQNIKFKIKNNWYYAKENEILIFSKLNKIPNIITTNDLLKTYSLSETNDYYQFVTAISFFNIKDDIIRMYLKAEHNRYQHERDIQMMNMLNQKLNNPNISFLEKEGCTQILTGRASGRILDYNALSELGTDNLPEYLQSQNISYAVVTLLVEDDINQEQSFDVDNIVKNEKDNLLITFMDDHDKLDDYLFEQSILDIEQKCQNIDCMSIEELLAFKSEVESISCDISLSSDILNRLSKVSNVIENVKEQLKQECIEKDDMYKMPSLNDYEELIR